MTIPSIASGTEAKANTAGPDRREFPVREYIAAMSVELAQMARWDGDEALGRLLDSAATLAAEVPDRPPVEIVEQRRRRPA